MKKDKLERFISENRDQFDSEVPAFKNWAAIEDSLDQKPKGRIIPIRRILSIAAAVVLLLFVGGAIGRYFTLQTLPVAAVEERVFPELLEIEQYYEEQVKEKVQLLAHYQENNSVLADLSELDTFVVELKTELQQVPEGEAEQVISNIIRSYQAKLDILEQVLYHLQNSDNQNSERDEISI